MKRPHKHPLLHALMWVFNNPHLLALTAVLVVSWRGN